MTSDESPGTIARTSLDAIVQFLESERIAYKLVEHDSVMSAAEEARAAGQPPDQVVKSRRVATATPS
jgi:hypothetical protein